ncbi:MAG TPA: ABC transporter permease [Ktedonobacterales bacterium]|nr:ABC transporter permease [Ktedonobacterales bacterium]
MKLLQALRRACGGGRLWELGSRTLAPVGRSCARAWPPVLLLLLLLAFWQLYVQAQDINPLILPAPLRIISATIASRSTFAAHIGTTLYETLVGLSAALAFGVLMAAIMDFSPFARRAIYPLLVASQAIPIVAIAPLLIFSFGFGLLPKVIVVTLICFFPITVSMADGLRSTDPELMKLYRTFGASELVIFWRVRLPHALPSFFSGLRIAATYAVVGAFLGELVSAIYGLGILFVYEERSFRTDLAFGDVIITALLSITLFALVSVIERIALPWYYAAGHERDWQDTGRRPRRGQARHKSRQADEAPALVQAALPREHSTQGKETQ